MTRRRPTSRPTTEQTTTLDIRSLSPRHPMTRFMTRFITRFAYLTAFAATALIFTACAEAPTAPVQPEAGLAPPTQTQASADAPKDGEPRFIPYNTPPRLRNSDHVRQRLQELYPSELREAGVAGVANVWLFIDEEGAVRESKLNRSSGSTDLDDAAVTLASEMRFQPAEHDGKPVAVWVQIPVSFQAGF